MVANALDFQVVYRDFHAEVARWVRLLGGPAAYCEDLTQDVFLVVHRRLSAFDGRNVAGWLYQITRHRVRDFRCRLWFRHLSIGVEPDDDLRQEGASPAEALETKRSFERLAASLEALSEPERAALLLFELDGYSGEEIARLQGVSINTCFSRIRRGRLRLRAAATVPPVDSKAHHPVAQTTELCLTQ